MTPDPWFPVLRRTRQLLRLYPTAGSTKKELLGAQLLIVARAESQLNIVKNDLFRQIREARDDD